MATPSIQTLITQAQQVLNLQSSNEIRATLAAVLANANVGTPLNPNLTTQQLWNEFGEIVRQSTDDIMSIITDQMMRMVFSPPAPGGAGADKQVIFNDGGVLAGDAGLMYNKATDALTITGDLTVDTNVLAVNATTNAVGIGTTVASVYSSKLRVEGGVEIHTSQALNIQPGNTNPYEIVNRSAGGFAFYPTGSALGMTLDASGNLLVGTPSLISGTAAGSLNIVGANTQQIQIRNSGAPAGAWWRQAVDVVNTFYILNDATAGVSIASGATSWSAVSDERLKDIIEPISNAIAKVGSLRSVIGKYKNDETNIRRSFLIAQDVQSVLPEAVDSSNPNELGLRYTEVIPLLVAAIKELTARVQTLEAR